MVNVEISSNESTIHMSKSNIITFIPYFSFIMNLFTTDNDTISTVSRFFEKSNDRQIIEKEKITLKCNLYLTDDDWRESNFILNYYFILFLTTYHIQNNYSRWWQDRKS